MSDLLQRAAQRAVCTMQLVKPPASLSRPWRCQFCECDRGSPAAAVAAALAVIPAANAAAIAASKAGTEDLKSTIISQNKSASNSMKVSLSSFESSLQKSLEAMDKRIASNETLNGVASRQQMTSKEIKALQMQSAEIRKLLEVQQNRITFP